MGVTLRELRVKLGLSQEKMARELDCTTQTILKSENGRSRPSLKVADKMIKYAHKQGFKMSYNELFDLRRISQSFKNKHLS